MQLLDLFLILRCSHNNVNNLTCFYSLIKALTVPFKFVFLLKPARHNSKKRRIVLSGSKMWPVNHSLVRAKSGAIGDTITLFYMFLSSTELVKKVMDSVSVVCNRHINLPYSVKTSSLS